MARTMVEDAQSVKGSPAVAAAPHPEEKSHRALWKGCLRASDRVADISET
jgi:hypothetical protein